MAVKTPLKWVGSKVRLMPQLRGHLPEGKRLVEPFAGSCAVMMNTDYDKYLIADLNPDLVNLYKAMAYHTDAFLMELEALFSAGALGEQESRAVFYYAVRDAFNLSGKPVQNITRESGFFYALHPLAGISLFLPHKRLSLRAASGAVPRSAF